MKFVLSAFCVVGLMSIGLSAQTVPDFSGTWTMDLSRSEAAAQGPAIGRVTLTIRQSPTEVRVETTSDGATETVRYLPVEAKTVTPEARVGTFRWEGAKLITNLATHINNQAVTVDEVRSLNSSGTEMTVEVTLAVQHGYTTGGNSVVQSPSHSPNVSTGKNVYLKAR